MSSELRIRLLPWQRDQEFGSYIAIVKDNQRRHGILEHKVMIDLAGRHKWEPVPVVETHEEQDR